MIEEKKHIEYMVLGFEQPFSGNLLNYHLLKCLEDGKKIHDVKQFYIDKVPNLFDTIQIKDDGLLNSFIKIKENPDLPKKMFDFLGQFDTLEKKMNDINDLKENQRKELEDALNAKSITETDYHQQLSEIETTFINKILFEDCVIEGLVTMCSEKLTQIRCDKLGYKIYHHELVKHMGIPVVSDIR